MKTFLHSGARGDIIYSLPTIKALGGGLLYIKLDPRTCGSESPYVPKGFPITAEEIPLFRHLLRDQPYISDVQLWNSESIDYELDKFRLEQNFMQNISQLHLKVFNISADLSQPWLNKKAFDPLHFSSIVINRSQRYHGPFDWQVLQDWTDQCIFIGTDEEHVAFREQTGLNIQRCILDSYHDMARVIAGSLLFIGNQSFPYSLAEAMKHPRVSETFPSVPNCLPIGPDGYTRLTQNIIRHYLLGEPLLPSPQLCYSQVWSVGTKMSSKRIPQPQTTYVIPFVENWQDFTTKYIRDGSEVIVGTGQGSFVEQANEGAARSKGRRICVLDLRSPVDFLKVRQMISKLDNRDGLVGSNMEQIEGTLCVTGPHFAVSRRAYEECGLFNLKSINPVLSLNLRYASRNYTRMKG